MIRLEPAKANLGSVSKGYCTVNTRTSTSRAASVLAVIPARGGSKGLPRKNVLPLAGRPVIAYSIKAALDSRLLSGIPVVSTDDCEIAEVARQWGAQVPFLRPSELSEDETATIPVLLHAIRWLEKNSSSSPDYIMLLQPTSPLRTAEDIDNVIQLALDNDADGVVSVCTSSHHPYLAKKVDQEGKIQDFIPIGGTHNRRQDLPSAYTVNGAIYLAKRDVLLEQQTFYTESTYAYIMPVERSLDIDTPWDLFLAERILESGLQTEGS